MKRISLTLGIAILFIIGVEIINLTIKAVVYFIANTVGINTMLVVLSTIAVIGIIVLSWHIAKSILKK